MATDTTHIRSGPLALAALVLAWLAGTATLCWTAASSSTAAPQATPSAISTGGDYASDEIETIGNAGRMPDSKKPKLTAYFERESFKPGDRATLVITDTAPQVTLQFFRAGTETVPTVPNDVMLGSPVSPATNLGAVHGRRVLELGIGNWPSGVYFARLTASGSRVGYAPFVLAPRRLGEHRVAVVLPTETWQAYNFRDDNGDGKGDTWYADWTHHQARLIRPFLDRGVPPHWKQYDAPFVRWIVQKHPGVDFLSDAELRAVPNGRALADAYTAIIFEGHHEYVTTHEYDVVTQYRDLGGNLAFLAANNFFWKITIRHDVMTRVAQWRDLGRPEAALIGVQYRANDNGKHRGPWILRAGAGSTPWLFAKTGAEPGGELGNGGIEIDHTAKSSPRSVRVLAEIPDLYGPGYTAQMSYYETAAGAKVFAAGAFTLAGSVWDDGVDELIENLWDRLTVA